MTFPLPGSSWTYTRSLRLLATTGVAGFTLQNATPTMFTWTTPSDGNMHRVLLNAFILVSSAQTGGAVTLDTVLPNGQAANPVIFAGGLSSNQAQFFARLIEPGSTVTLMQSSAQTAGSALVWAELWGS